MSYERINWEDTPSTKTPINAENLNKMDQGIFSAHEQLDAIPDWAKEEEKPSYTPEDIGSYTKEEIDVLKANSILSQASGEVVTTTDSAKVKPKNIKLFGKGKQRQYEGNQLLDSSEFDSLEYNGVTMTVEDGRVILNGTATNNIDFYLINDGKNIDVRAKLNAKLGVYTLSNNLGVENWFASTTGYTVDNITITSETQLTGAFVRIKSGATYNNSILEIMLNEGDTPKPWEPFVGNEPSPNMNYPQKAEFLGESGSVGGKVLSGNIYDSSFRRPYDGTISSYGCTTEEVNGVFSVTATREDIFVNNVGNNNQNYDANSNGCLMSIPNDATKISVKLSSAEFNKNFISYYDENKVLIGFYNNTTNEFTHTIKTGAKYFTLRFGKGDAVAGTTYETTVMVCFGEQKEYEPYTEQPFTSLTPNGLRGIPLGQTIPDAIKNSPIHMAGVYWDEVEQQYYIADTKNEDGKDVQRVLKATIDGNSDVFDYNNPLDTSNIFGFFINGIVKDTQVLCDKLTNRGVWSKDINGIWVGVNNAISIRLNNNLTGITTEDTSSQKVAKVKELLTNNPIEIYYWSIIDPIITGTTEEEKAQLDALVMNYPNTTIVNDEGAYMEVEYVADTQEYIKQNYVPKEEFDKLQIAVSEIQLALVNS